MSEFIKSIMVEIYLKTKVSRTSEEEFWVKMAFRKLHFKQYKYNIYL